MTKNNNETMVVALIIGIFIGAVLVGIIANSNMNVLGNELRDCKNKFDKCEDDFNTYEEYGKKCDIDLTICENKLDRCETDYSCKSQLNSCNSQLTSCRYQKDNIEKNYDTLAENYANYKCCGFMGTKYWYKSGYSVFCTNSATTYTERC